MIDEAKAFYYGIEPSRDFMHGLGTDPSATIKTERFYATPLREKDENGDYNAVETVDEFISENFSVLTLLYYTLCNVCKETGKERADVSVCGIACDTTNGGKTVHFRHYAKE